MAINKDPLFIGVITGKLAIYSSDATTEQAIFQGDATYATRVDELSVFTDDTANKDLLLYFHDGTNSRQIATVQVPANSGNTNAIAAVNLMTSTYMAAHVQTDAAGNTFINLPPGWSKIGRAHV
jgi:hypothetical protein